MDKEENTKQLISLLERLLTVAKKQKNLLKEVMEVNKILEETIRIKDETMDKQLQIIQILELKLKDFGYELGDTI